MSDYSNNYSYNSFYQPANNENCNNYYQPQPVVVQPPIQVQQPAEKYIKINAVKILQNIPTFLVNEVTITINVYANESKTLQPCQQERISTGIAVVSEFPASHGIAFEGFKNTMDVYAADSKAFPSYGKEISVKVINYSGVEKKIFAGMPLGRVIITPN